jgi:hypothetical protein
VDIDPDSGRPVVEQALPKARDDLTAALSSRAVHGKAMLRPDRTAACAPAFFQHRTFRLKATPLGSNPTMSKRASTLGRRNDGAAAANATADPPGPPGLTKRDPILCLWSLALIRRTATEVFAPRGLS